MAHLDASFTSLRQECAQEDDSMMELEEPLNVRLVCFLSTKEFRSRGQCSVFFFRQVLPGADYSNFCSFESTFVVCYRVG